MPEIPGLDLPVFLGDDIRVMTAADRAAIREADDPDALLSLQLKLRTGTYVRGRRPVLLATGVLAIWTGYLILGSAGPLLSLVALTALLIMLVVAFTMQRRARRRVKNAVGWLGALDFRLAQLAARSAD